MKILRSVRSNREGEIGARAVRLFLHWSHVFSVCVCLCASSAQLENRLLADLEASLPQSPSGFGRSTLSLARDVADEADSSDEEGESVGVNPLEYNPANFSPVSPGRSQKRMHERMGSRSKLVSQIDPLAEEALLIARRAQKERQAAISEALQANAIPNSQRQLSTSGSQPNSQRTSTSNLSAAVKQR